MGAARFAVILRLNLYVPAFHLSAISNLNEFSKRVLTRCCIYLHYTFGLVFNRLIYKHGIFLYELYRIIIKILAHNLLPVVFEFYFYYSVSCNECTYIIYEIL